MPMLMISGAHASEAISTMERLPLDFGGECCDCPMYYMPECPVERLPGALTPNSVTVTGDPMNVHGSKCVQDTMLPQGLVDPRARPCLRHSLHGGQRRRTMPLLAQRFARLQAGDCALARTSPRRRHYRSWTTSWSPRPTVDHDTARTSTWFSVVQFTLFCITHFLVYTARVFHDR